MKQNDGVIDNMKGRTSGEDNGTITNPQLNYISSCESDAEKQFSSVPKKVKVFNKCKYNRCLLKIKRAYNFSFAHSQFFSHVFFCRSSQYISTQTHLLLPGNIFHARSNVVGYRFPLWFPFQTFPTGPGLVK